METNTRQKNRVKPSISIEGVLEIASSVEYMVEHDTGSKLKKKNSKGLILYLMMWLKDSGVEVEHDSEPSQAWVSCRLCGRGILPGEHAERGICGICQP